MYDNYNKTTIVDLWLKRDLSQRKTDNDILSFYSELQRHHADLIVFLKGYSPNSSDTYQVLKSFLRLDTTMQG